MLLDSMIRNFKRHRVQEAQEGFEWAQWQAIQLKNLQDFRRDNLRKYSKKFDKLNKEIEKHVANAYERGKKDETELIDRATQSGFQGEFFQVPNQLNALLEAINSDMTQAEYAVLRRADDIYRQTIYDAAILAQSGAGTYEQSIDMATHDFIAKGVNGITYRNGSRHGIREYAQMAIRTASKRAYLVAQGEMRKSWGVHTVFVDYRDEACPLCLEWVGEILVDDVYSGGTVEEARESGYALMSEAMAEGLFHPNCKDTLSTYFPGITQPPRKLDEAQVIMTETAEEAEQIRKSYINKSRAYERLERFSLDKKNIDYYQAKKEEYAKKAEDAHIDRQDLKLIGDSDDDGNLQILLDLTDTTDEEKKALASGKVLLRDKDKTTDAAADAITSTIESLLGEFKIALDAQSDDFTRLANVRMRTTAEVSEETGLDVFNAVGVAGYFGTIPDDSPAQASHNFGIAINANNINSTRIAMGEEEAIKHAQYTIRHEFCHYLCWLLNPRDVKKRRKLAEDIVREACTEYAKFANITDPSYTNSKMIGEFVSDYAASSYINEKYEEVIAESLANSYESDPSKLVMITKELLEKEINKQ